MNIDLDGILLQAPVISTPPSDKQAQPPSPTAPQLPAAKPNVRSQTDTPQSKRQKVEQPGSMDSKPAAQLLQEARSVATATKEQLGVTCKAFDLAVLAKSDLPTKAFHGNHGDTM